MTQDPHSAGGLEGSAAAHPPAGWYPDPYDAERTRYWDGGAWSEHTAPAAGRPPSGDGSPAAGGGPAAGGVPAAGGAPAEGGAPAAEETPAAGASPPAG